MHRVAMLCLLAGVSLPIYAQTAPAEPAAQTPPAQGDVKTYAQALVDAAVAQHPELLELDLHAKPPGSAQAPAKGSCARSTNRTRRPPSSPSATTITSAVRLGRGYSFFPSVIARPRRV